MRNLVRTVLLVWFVTVSAFILYPSYRLLSMASHSPTPEQLRPPERPVAPLFRALERPATSPADDAQRKSELAVIKLQADVYAQQAAVYSQDVTAYAQQLAAQKNYRESVKGYGYESAYQLAVKETLVTLIPAFLAAVLAYAWANAGATVLNNRTRAAKNLEMEELHLL